MLNYLAHIWTFVAIFLMLAASLNLILGFGGIFSIMQAAFYGVGAYTAALIVVHAHLPFPLELVGAFAISAFVGAVIGVPLMRLGHDRVVVGTLALQLVVAAIFRNWTAVTGGSYGIFGIPRPSLFGGIVSSVPAFAILATVVAVLCFSLALTIARSPFGLALRAQREDDVLASSLGHDARRERMLIFIIGAGVAGVAGGVYAEFVGYIDPSSFDVNQSLSIITIVVVGGLANLWGTLGAAIVLTFLPQLLILLPGASDAEAQLQLLLYGVILVAIVRFWPHGLIPEQPAVRARDVAPLRAQDAPDGDAILDRLAGIRIETSETPGPRIVVTDVHKHYGGIHAVDGASLEIAPLRVTALIGPNGAGKTTLFNVICGLATPDRGRVAIGSEDTTKLRPFEIARLGVTRTFQDVRLFPRLTVLENLVFALSRANRTTRDRSNALRAELVRRSLETTVDIGLASQADTAAGSLSYAQQKLLMMGIVLVRGDNVIFLDEIASGLDQRSIHDLASLVRRLAESGRTVCLVEHNLSFVWEVADDVIVLDHGRVIASGTPQAVQADPTVVEIYFAKSSSLTNA